MVACFEFKISLAKVRICFHLKLSSKQYKKGKLVNLLL